MSLTGVGNTLKFCYWIAHTAAAARQAAACQPLAARRPPPTARLQQAVAPLVVHFRRPSLPQGRDWLYVDDRESMGKTWSLGYLNQNRYDGSGSSRWSSSVRVTKKTPMTLLDHGLIVHVELRVRQKSHDASGSWVNGRCAITADPKPCAASRALQVSTWSAQEAA